jgi:putative transposase
MPRRARSILGGYAYHILNRANGRLRLFKKKADFDAFEEVLAQAFERVPLRILGYTLMGNHWSRRAGIGPSKVSMSRCRNSFAG